MLVVKVEIWPGGRRDGAREIGRAAIANMSSLAEISDYVGVLVNEHDDTSVATVRRHRRAAGFWPLIARLCSPRASTRLSARDRAAAARMLPLITGPDTATTTTTAATASTDDRDVTVTFVAGLVNR